MNEDEVLKYLSAQASTSKTPAKMRVRQPATRVPQQSEGYKDFSATQLFCPICKTAMPVRERLMLYLPTGNLYDYTCERCGTSVGTRNA